MAVLQFIEFLKKSSKNKWLNNSVEMYHGIKPLLMQITPFLFSGSTKAGIVGDT